VFQWNKRDSPVATPIERLHKALNPQGWPEFEAVASEGKGVSETLRAACKAVLARLGSGHAPTAASPNAPIPVPHASMPQRTTGAPSAVATAAPPAIATATVAPPAIATLPAPPSAASLGVATTVATTAAPPLAPAMRSPVAKSAPAAAEPSQAAPPAIAPSLPGPPQRS
jgi:hypothetical protein